MADNLCFGFVRVHFSPAALFLAAMNEAPPHPMAKPAEAWFATLRDRICAAFEAIEAEEVVGTNAAKPPGKFVFTPWSRPEGGGGTMGVMRGRVLQKAGVNVSTVHGEFTPEFRKQIPGAEEDPRFLATGISLVVHPWNPNAPTVHMNTRFIATTRAWFGGGGDITPMDKETAESIEDAAFFKAAYQTVCDRHDPSYYPRFAKWCEEYFYLPHRNETRGLGGIFYDWLGDRTPGHGAEADFAFTREVGDAFLAAYPTILRRRMNTPFGDAELAKQRHRRGRYVEFNLLHDRGTLFGLRTGGNVEAILMSLPPDAAW